MIYNPLRSEIITGTTNLQFSLLFSDMQLDNIKTRNDKKRFKLKCCVYSQFTSPFS